MDKFYINSIPVYRRLSSDEIEYEFLLFENNEKSNKVLVNVSVPEQVQFEIILDIVKQITEEELKIYKDEQFHESGS